MNKTTIFKTTIFTTALVFLLVLPQIIYAQNALTRLNRGITFLNNGDYTSAIREFTEAIRLAPNNAEAYYNRGNAYLAADEYARAIADWEAVLRIQPDHTNAMNLYRTHAPSFMAFYISTYISANIDPYINISAVFQKSPNKDITYIDILQAFCHALDPNGIDKYDYAGKRANESDSSFELRIIYFITLKFYHSLCNYFMGLTLNEEEDLELVKLAGQRSNALIAMSEEIASNINNPVDSKEHVFQQFFWDEFTVLGVLVGPASKIQQMAGTGWQKSQKLSMQNADPYFQKIAEFLPQLWLQTHGN